MVTLTEEDAIQLTDQIVDSSLNVRQTEALVKKIKSPNERREYSASSSSSINPNIEFLEKELTTLLGLKVEFSHKSNNSGKMCINYKSLDQIQPVIDKLKWRPK